MGLTRNINIEIILTVLAAAAFADPVVITGKDLPRLLGKPIASIVVLNKSGAAIPFQIDEVTKDGEYVLDKGELPNVREGNDTLNERDEIAFLWDDADDAGAVSAGNGVNNGIGTTITLTRGKEKRTVTVVLDTTSSLPRSPKNYIGYNHNTGRVVTEYYYADFAKNRFHFVRAGVMDFVSNKYVDLTNELRVEILLKTLFGLIPIRYGEGDIVCFVRRYKVGPIRLIRRGDFHLNLGFGVKGSRAAVNQICYSRMVKVPVYVHLPFRFRNLFGQAHVEMTPVIREAGRRFTFAVPSKKLYFPVSGDRLDTLCLSMPLRRMFTLKNGAAGYGWILDATTPPEHISGSGFIMRRPGTREAGTAECGFRLTVRDVPKGNYYITNWVLFSGGKAGDIERLGEGLMEPVAISEEKYGDR
ncbi:MAG: hypothetical protein LBB74_02465 [Chitinispirillales bacterium]|jgi:hypothetical protein|nr:hypothetical protein [Chitinispirillales bacterium]